MMRKVRRSEGGIVTTDFPTFPFPAFRRSGLRFQLPPLPRTSVPLRLAELVAQLVPRVPAAPHGGATHPRGAGAQGSARFGPGAGCREECPTGAEDHAEGEAGSEQGNFLPIGLAVRVRAGWSVGGSRTGAG